jgi:hypothetical protein
MGEAGRASIASGQLGTDAQVAQRAIDTGGTLLTVYAIAVPLLAFLIVRTLSAQPRIRM